MLINRREFSNLSLMAAAGLVTGAPLRALARMQSGETIFEWTQVSPGGMAAIGGGGNSLVVFDREEAVLIDAKNPGLGIILRIEAEIVTRTRPGVLINTHHHADHTGGNDAFTPDLLVIAQANALPRIEGQIDRYRADLGKPIKQLRDSGVSHAHQAADALEKQAARASKKKPSDYMPKRTVQSEEEFRHGDNVLELIHIGAGHTDNDLFIIIPRHNVLHTGDLVFQGMHPYCNPEHGASTVGWEQSLEAMYKRCNADTVVIPGHGNIGDHSEIRVQQEYFRNCREAVQQWINEGRSKDEVAELEVEQYKDYGFDRGGRLVRETLYEELTTG